MPKLVNIPKLTSVTIWQVGQLASVTIVIVRQIKNWIVAKWE